MREVTAPNHTHVLIYADLARIHTEHDRYRDDPGGAGVTVDDYITAAMGWFREAYRRQGRHPVAADYLEWSLVSGPGGEYPATLHVEERLYQWLLFEAGRAETEVPIVIDAVVQRFIASKVRTGCPVSSDDVRQWDSIGTVAT